MIRKFSFLIGLAIGYVAGTQASIQQRARVSRAMDRLWDDPRLQKVRPRSASVEDTFESEAA